MNIDPLAEDYFTLSPYAYVANSPILLFDPDGKRISFSYNRDENGDISEITITVTGKLINNSSRNFNEKQMERRRQKILKGLDDIEVVGGKSKFVGDIEIANSENEIEATDHIFRIVDNIDQVPGLKMEKGVNPTAYAFLNENVIYLERNFSSLDVAHETGHSAGLKHIHESSQADFSPDAVDYFNSIRECRCYHPEVTREQAGAFLKKMYTNFYDYDSLPGNLMHRGVRPGPNGDLITNKNRGAKVTPDQVQAIINKIKNGKINRGKQR